MTILFLVICCFFFATGILFTIIDLRVKYDRTLRYFGFSLIILSLLAAIDLHTAISVLTTEQMLYWERILHVLACGFFLFSLAYLCLIAGIKKPNLIRAMTFLSALFALLSLTGLMLRIESNEVVGGALYSSLFFPYVLFYIAYSHFAIISSLRKTAETERRILRFHLIGYGVLCIAGLLDMVVLLSPNLGLIPSYKLVGICFFGAMGTMIFAERLLGILKEREKTFRSLQSAYNDLEKVSTLKELGESTAIINHEIKNYVFMISGNAKLLQETEKLPGRSGKLLENIVTSVERMERMASEILDFSKMNLALEKKQVNLAEVARSCIETHFPQWSPHFNLDEMENANLIYGDWGKLEQMFQHLFQNCIDASRDSELQVTVTTKRANHVLLVSIEDNGRGCKGIQLEHLFRAFYTTKSKREHSGLGMAMSRGIVASHGGRISAYTKNTECDDSITGFIVNLVFPLYSQGTNGEEWDQKNSIVLIKGALQNLARILRVFQNVRVNPHVVQDVEELRTNIPHHRHMKILISPEEFGRELQANAQPEGDIYLLKSYENNIYILGAGTNRETGQTEPHIFSEKFVLRFLLDSDSPAPAVEANEVLAQWNRTFGEKHQPI